MANLRANKIVSTTGSNAITGSVEFDGTGDYLVPTGSDFGLSSSEDFTIEMWIHATAFNNSSTYSEVIRQGTSNASTDGMYLNTLTAGTLEWRLSGTTKTSTNKMTAGSWNHIAVCRASGTVYISVNGLTENFGSVTNSSTTSAFRIGADFEGNNFFEGHLSNVRFVKGTALYTDNFIPPTAELKNIPGTVLLCCQDPKSATQEVTGKTITVNGSATARNFAPPVGSDGSIEFVGPTKINTENYFYLPTGPTEQREPVFPGGNVGGNARGLFGGGYVGPPTNIIDYITISSTGDATDFGDLTQARLRLQSCSSNTRGVFGGGDTLPSTNYNIIDYVTIASTGNAQDFGDLFQTRKGVASCSNSTRGLFAAGDTPTQVNTIDYITIASTGNAQDFGDLTRVTLQPAACSSPTRGVFAGGNPATNTIDFITIQTQGNAFDFGDLIEAGVGLAALSSSTRGVFAGGYNAPADKNTIQYINISTTSNATDFGDLPVARYGASGCSSSTRGIIGGGYSAPAQRNIIEYITIASIGNAQDFGDLTATRSSAGACSNGHGGLG